jgi:hypothetical protein
MKKFCIIPALTILFYTSIYADESKKNESAPDVSIGITGSFGSFNMTEKNVGIDKKPGMITGGGLSIEKMISPWFGIGTGIQYRYFNFDFTMNDSNAAFDVTWAFQSINIPFLMILSFGGDNSSINFMGGVVYSHIFYSVMTTDTDLPVNTHRDNTMRFTDTNQAGVSAGIIFKIKATEYTDFLFGVTGEYYPTNLLYDRGDSNDRLNMYNYSLTVGYMFRTGLFPGSSNE